MSTLGLLMALMALMALCLSTTTTSVSAAPKKAWTMVCELAPWAPRFGGVVEFYPGTSKAVGITRALQGPMFLLYGTGMYQSTVGSPEERNDVWASTNYGKGWVLVDTTTGFAPSQSAATVQDHNGRQFRIQGSGPGNAYYDDVWMSGNGGVSWSKQNPTASGGLNDVRFLGAAAVDRMNNIYLTAGQKGAGDQNVLSDVWRSANSGKTWQSMNLNAPWGPRTAHMSIATTMPNPDAISGDPDSALLDILYVMAGYSRYDSITNAGLYHNDIWVSSSMGKSWSVLTKSAAWPARGDSQVEITSNGIMVVVAGVLSRSGGLTNLVTNDVWASLDGGYSWGQCTADAEWSDRQFQMTAFDTDGVAYVFGGWEVDNSTGTRHVMNDVWKSSFSYNDPTTVSEQCNILIPACGVGLRCWPGSSGFQAGLWGVSCDACPFSSTLAGVVSKSSSSSSSPISPALIGLFVFLGLFLITLLALFYTYYRLRASGVTSPIPLPASAERWWNKGTSNGAISLQGMGSVPLVDTQQKETSDLY